MPTHQARQAVELTSAAAFARRRRWMTPVRRRTDRARAIDDLDTFLEEARKLQKADVPHDVTGLPAPLATGGPPLEAKGAGWRRGWNWNPTFSERADEGCGIAISRCTDVIARIALDI